MIIGIQDVYYNVADMERALKFYQTALGLQKAFGDSYWSVVKCGELSIGLHWTEGGAVPEVPRDSHGAHAGATVTFKSSDIAADRKNLEKAGAKILGESDQPWGHMLVFEDPDGNVLKLMKPKG